MNNENGFRRVLRALRNMDRPENQSSPHHTAVPGHEHCITPDVIERVQGAIVACIIEGRTPENIDALHDALAGNDFLQMIYEAGVTRGMASIVEKIKNG